MGENSRNLLSPSCGGEKSELQVAAGLVPSGGSEGGPAPGLSAHFCWLLAALDAPWLVDTSPHSMSPSHGGLPVTSDYISVHIPVFLREDQSLDQGPR